MAPPDADDTGQTAVIDDAAHDPAPPEEHDDGEHDDRLHGRDGTDAGSDGDADGGRRGFGQRLVAFARRHRIFTGVFIVLLPLFVLVFYSWARAMTKEGSESFTARNVQWLRDLHLDPLVDRIEQKYYEDNQPEAGGRPDESIGPVAGAANGPVTTVAPNGNKPAAPASTIPHSQVPAPMKSPAADTLPNEGEWFPAGPDLGGGVHGVYYTKVRPNDSRTSLLVFVAWMDPKVAQIKQFPGTELPGGKWSTPNSITPEMCPQAILAVNGGFRMEASRGGWYAEGRQPFPLKNGAASLVFYKDGRVDVGQYGRDIGPDQLGQVDTIRQNLELMVDNGQPVANIDTNNWGALLPNSYFVWRSGFGITKDGALIFIGGPGLTPRDLANRFIDAGAVRAMEGDINPEWVTSNFYSVGADGKCTGTPGLTGSQDKGGQRQPGDRYLSTDTRDFVAVFSRKT